MHCRQVHRYMITLDGIPVQEQRRDALRREPTRYIDHFGVNTRPSKTHVLRVGFAVHRRLQHGGRKH